MQTGAATKIAESFEWLKDVIGTDTVADEGRRNLGTKMIDKERHHDACAVTEAMILFQSHFLGLVISFRLCRSSSINISLFNWCLCSNVGCIEDGQDSSNQKGETDETISISPQRTM